MATELMHALITFPLTSISQAPQLPPRHPVGIGFLAAFANTNQSSPGVAWLIKPLGHRIVTEVFLFGIAVI
jgi:hypothetical protein